MLLPVELSNCVVPLSTAGAGWRCAVVGWGETSETSPGKVFVFLLSILMLLACLVRCSVGGGHCCKVVLSFESIAIFLFFFYLLSNTVWDRVKELSSLFFFPTSTRCLFYLVLAFGILFLSVLVHFSGWFWEWVVWNKSKSWPKREAIGQKMGLVGDISFSDVEGSFGWRKMKCWSAEQKISTKLQIVLTIPSLRQFSI